MAVRFPSALLVTAALILGSGNAAEPSEAANDFPLKLQWKSDGGTVTIKVVGNTQTQMELWYTLEVNGTSHTKSSGRATLRPGHQVVISTASINGNTNWKAKLTVEGARTYVLQAPD